MDHNDKVHSISEFVSSFIGKLGIVSLEVGTIQESTGKWTTVEGYCAKDLTALHMSASTEFLHKYSNQYGDNQPINYIYEYWRNKQDRTEEIVYYSFGCDGFIGSSDDSSVKKIDALAEKDEPHQYELTTRNDIVENIHSGEASRNNTSKDSSTDFLEVFKKSQAEFTAIVLNKFNKVLKEDAKIKYVTIVLFRTKYDEKWHLSYNAAIFSDNLCYLKVPEFNLLFDYISRGNYLNEIRHLKHTVQKEAIKSAVSAIMSRNMSHNLGSHYLYYTKAHLEKIATDFWGFGDQLGQYAPDVRGAAKVLGYVQGRMDYLATVISNDKYPYGAVNFKSHIFDELTIDDFSARHFDTEKKRNLRTTNYLLTNLVLSENFTRPNVRDGEFPLGKYLLLLRAKLMMRPGIYSEFTGFVDYMEEENDVKKQLAQLHIALPGGTMSCHAFFNVIENFIRNSAKYLQADFKSIGEGLPYLNCTIAIRPNKDNKDFYDFIIYDNKENANKLVDPATHMTLFESIVGNVGARTIKESEIVKKEELGILGRLRITDENGHIEKEAKGIKEMLFSSVWMNAYHFGDNTYADIIAHINDFFDPEKDKVTYKMYKEKLEYIESYAFKFVQVIDNGESLLVFTREQMQANQEKDVTASLGLLITLPEFKQEGYFVPNEDENLMKQNLLTLFADIVNVPKKYAFQNEKIVFSGCFTRPFYDETKDASVDKYRTILRRRFNNFDKYAIQLGDDSSESLLGPQGTERSYIIRFKRHMNKDKASLFEKNRDYAYADSVSGGNFTITLQQLLEEGWKGDSFNEETQFFALKVIESALTRITIIDERLFNSGAKGSEDELSLKNIRVLNYNTFEDKMSDVIVSCNKYISQGIRGERGDLELMEFIKQRATEAITEAFVSVKRCPQDKLSVDEQLYLKNKKEYVCDSILDALSSAINETTDRIERYKAESDINTKMSYKKAIRNYVDTLKNRIKNASALVELVEPYVDDIKGLIVSVVNEFANGNLSCILQGNNFRDGKENTLFLSIHLGLIEKMLKNSEWLNCEITNRLASKNASARKSQKVTDRLSKERVEEFMSILKEKFISTDNEGNNELFIAIHSGRGNFSKELEGPLKTYPFITLSAIENAFNNSKYLLSQVFYNTVYIGKGIANE